MPDLYTSPTEARRETAGIGKTGNFWQDWYTDRVRDGIKFNDETGEYDKTGFAFYGDLFGRNNQEAVTKIEEGKSKVRDSTKIESTLKQFPGVTDEQILEASGGKKITAGNVKGVVAEAVRTRSEKPTPVQQTQLTLQKEEGTRATKAQEDATDIARETLADQKDGRESTQTIMLREMQQQAVESRLDRAERADQRADDRMMQIEMFERADAKDEKNRRRESIQALIGGLSSLGAAFAV